MKDFLRRLWARIYLDYWGVTIFVGILLLMLSIAGVMLMPGGTISVQLEAERVSNPFGEEILHNTFDDGHGSVFIKVDRPVSYEIDKSIEELMNKKRDWEREVPDQKVIAATLVYVPRGGAIYGLLLHYEPR